ncbi:unnamed protein product [Polarella glacialis]|uniref:PI3K/PI4K catalytic domain-containing protein n=1 Tax=Polarella glacialis TaxID=89957 RepID=A0A813GIZ7_POLGL|nr:unnamed protein product [Polarella glacialis]CAE8721157.1 unnamed protein product [Polarella glacialis]
MAQEPVGVTRADVRDEIGSALGIFAEVLRRELDQLGSDLRQALEKTSHAEKPFQQADLCSVLDEWWAGVAGADREGIRKNSLGGPAEQHLKGRSNSPTRTECLFEAGGRSNKCASGHFAASGDLTAPRSRSPPASPESLPADLSSSCPPTPQLSAMSSPGGTQPSTPSLTFQLDHASGGRKDWRRSFVENATKVNRKIQYLSEVPQCRETEEINDVLEEAIKALEDGIKPHLVEDGLGGTYFVKDRLGEVVAVFKPRDEEALARNNPKVHAGEGQGVGLKEGVLVGEAAINEYAAFLLDRASGPLRAGVCPTALVQVANSVFHSASEDRRSAFRKIKDKVGSFQLFAKHNCTSEDLGPGRFPADQVHLIAALDIRLCNTDRHSGNILVREEGGVVKAMVPIDHGYALPGEIGDVTFEWMSWPAAKQPFSQQMRSAIVAISLDEVESLLKRRTPMLRPECLATLRTCTTLLQRGVEAGLTAFDIGSMMIRPDDGKASELEDMVAESRQCRQVYQFRGDVVTAPRPTLEELISTRCLQMAEKRNSQKS